jgi:DNA-binding CsgD family transcriptional regulator
MQKPYSRHIVPTPPPLTSSEVRVLELVAVGLSTKVIARRLYISEKAVEYHIRHLLWKFDTRNRAGVVARAYVLGYLAPETWPPVASTNRRTVGLPAADLSLLNSTVPQHPSREEHFQQDGRYRFS